MITQQGQIVCSLAPTAIAGQPTNPRNSEGDFITTSDGRILFIYSRYEGDTYADDANSDIACIESHDEGRTWTSPRILFRNADEGTKNIMSVTLRRMHNGDIGLFYLRRVNSAKLLLILRRSGDEGSTWSSPVFCTDMPGYYVVNNDRVLCMTSGRLVVPAAFHAPSDNGGSGVISRACARFFISDDDGFTWHATDNILSLNCNHTGTGLQEPGLVELGNGILWGYARTDLGRQYEFFSYDGGESWTPPQPSAFTSPISPMLIKRCPYDNKLYAVWNPVPLYPGHDDLPSSWGRTPLVLAVSDDEGKTWSKPLILEDDEERGFCYPALHFGPDYLLLAYCAGGKKDGICLSRTDIRRICVKY